MKKRLLLDQLRVGMFVEAQVQSVLADGEIRYYLEVRDTAFAAAGTKRLRLAKRKQEQIARDGGMLVTSQKHIASLREIGVTEVVVDADKSEVIPDHWLASHREPAGKSPRTRTGPPAAPPPEEDSEGEELSLDMVDFPMPGPPAPWPPPEEVAAPTGTRRTAFGRAYNAWMKVEIKAEGTEAFLQVLSFGGDRELGEKEMLRALEENYGIRAGIDRGLLGRLAAQAAASPTRVIRGQFPIARRPRPDPAQFGRIEYTFLKDLPEAAGLSHARLQQAFAGESLAQVLAPGLRVRLALPGEELAVFVPAGDQRAIRDIFGNTEPVAGAEMLLRAGPHVRMEGGRYLSEIYGYVCLLDGELSVIPPVWISPDCMEAHYIHFPRVGPGAAPTWEWLAQLLERREIRCGLREPEIEALLRHPPEGAQAASYLVARGTPPGSQEDRITLEFGAVENLAPLSPVQARHAASKVSAGQLLAQVRPAAEQYPGTDLAGRAALPAAGEEAELKAGRHVRSDYQEGVQCFYAEIDGRASIEEHTLRVRPIVYIDHPVHGDLDLSQADQDAHIKGAVRAGAVVKVKGSAVVEGAV